MRLTPNRLAGLALLTLLLAAPVGCAFEREIWNVKGPDAPKALAPPAARFLVERPGGDVTGETRAVVRLFRADGPTFEHDLQYRFEREGEFLVEGIPAGDYDVEAFVDLNGTLEPEVGRDAVAGRLAAPYDPFATTRVTLRDGETTRVDLRLLDPIPSGTPAPGDVAVGIYANFEWDPLPTAAAYDFRVRNEAGDDLYRARLFAPRVRYGDSPSPAEGALLKFPEPLGVNTWYRWTVTAVDGDGRALAYLASRRFVP